jgi:hypothetical protein
MENTKPKIAILVPSRERLNLKLTLISSIITTVSDINNIELLFGIDKDDPTRDIVYKIAAAIPFVKIIDINNEGKFIGINKIWNLLYKETDADILGYIGDDMIFRTPNWDVEVIKEFTGGKLPDDKIKLVHCDDGYHGSKLCVNAFIHRAYTDIVGYFCRGEFPINYSDSWFMNVFGASNRITYLPQVYIEHNHWILNKRQKDKVADRMLADDTSTISDKLWMDLTPQRIEEVKKIASIVGVEPNWNKVDHYDFPR